jgi:hypothetical protein
MCRGDTFVILGSATGMVVGGWLNFQLGIIQGSPQQVMLLQPPYLIIWPAGAFALSALRLVIGLAIVAVSRTILKPTFRTTISLFFKVSC